MSIAGGFPRAVERARAVEATALQIFVKSARQWRCRALPWEECAAFRREVERVGLTGCVLAHASYLINMASPERKLRQRSLGAAAEELERCAALGVDAYVLHPGSCRQGERARGLERVAVGLDRLHDPRTRAGRRRRSVRILLELTAGQGSSLGASFDELAAILEAARRDGRLGICFDTCHALAAGYEFRDPRAYRALWREADRKLGLERVGAIHLNDSRAGIGSRVDRHAHIGEGEVGLEAFRLLLNDPRFRDVPMVLETPKDGEDLEADRRNLAVLRAMIGR